MGACCAAALIEVSPSAARATRANLRVFEISGRWPRTANPCLSMARRISCPPRENNSRSIASSRSTIRTRGKPRLNHSRARSTSNSINRQKSLLLLARGNVGFSSHCAHASLRAEDRFAFSVIHANVLPEVSQLQGGARVVREFLAVRHHCTRTGTEPDVQRGWRNIGSSQEGHRTSRSE